MAFEAFPQAKGMLFLCPYINFSWYNNPLGGGRYDTNDKVRQMVFGLFTEYGVTDKFTIGGDAYLIETWRSKNGKIGGPIGDRSFQLNYLQLFGRYTFFNRDGFVFSAYTAVWTPSFGDGTGTLSKFAPYNKWSNEFRIEGGYRFANGDQFVATLGYKAQYNQTRDVLTMKLSYTHKFPWDIFFMVWLKKNTYLNKGNKLYAFAKDNRFDIDCFNPINNNGYVALDVFLMKKVAKGQFAGIAYTHSMSASWLGNKGMRYDYRAFWVEYWLFLK